MPNHISISYNGGIAQDGRLHYYEYGRAQYALARLVATVEHFRRTGAVADRINRSSYVDIIVSVPKSGSFVTELVLPALRESAATVVSAPITAFFAHVLHLVTPRLEKTDEAITELARIRLAEEQERTEQSRQETERVNALARIVSDQSATARQSLELVRWAQKTTSEAIERANIDVEDLAKMEAEFTAEIDRAQEISRFEDELSKLDPDTLARLTSRIRPMLKEAALPLRRSAESFSFQDADNDNVIGFFDRERADAIQDRETHEDPITIDCKIKAYDIEIGVGKVRSDALPRVLNFIVSSELRRPLRNKILTAMTRDSVSATFLKVTDDSNQITSLFLLEIELE